MRSHHKTILLVMLSFSLFTPFSAICMYNYGQSIEIMAEDEKKPCCTLSCCPTRSADTSEYLIYNDENKKKLTCNVLSSIKKLFKRSNEHDLENGLSEFLQTIQVESDEQIETQACCAKITNKKIATESLELLTKGTLAYLSLWLYGNDSLTFFAQNHFAQNIARHLPSKKRYLLPTITVLYFASIGSKLFDGYIGFDTNTHIIGLLAILNLINSAFSKINQPSTELTQDDVRNLVIQVLEEEKNK